MTHLRAAPCTLKQANSLIKELHRHHKPVVGHRFSMAAYKGTRLVGAAVCGRPVARCVDQSSVLEVTRLVTDGSKNTCSFLYARCAQVAQSMGFQFIQTYILDTEPGTSLKASGWINEGVVRPNGKGWNNRPGRAIDQPTVPKQRWRKYFSMNNPEQAESSKPRRMKPHNPREENDLYRTKPELALAICNLVTKRLHYRLYEQGVYPKPPKRLDVLEPGCYDGPFLKAMDECWPENRDMSLTGTDIVKRPPEFDYDLADYVHTDFADLSEEGREKLGSDFHLIIGNPPFKHMEEFLKTSKELLHKDGEIVFIAQVGFLGSRSRYDLFKEHQPWRADFLLPRPGFIRDDKPNGSDARDYVLLTWKSWNPPYCTQFKWFDWKQTTELKQPYQDDSR